MAVPLEFVNVVIHKANAERAVPGIIDALARDEPPNWAEDEHLVRVGFMSTRDADSFVGGHLPDGDRAAAVAVIASPYPAPPSWLHLGVVDDQPACWLANVGPGALALPFGISELYALPPGTTWAELAAALEGVSVCAVARDAEKYVLVRDGAETCAWLIQRESETVLMIAQSISRRIVRDADWRLTADVVTMLVRAFGASIWDPEGHRQP